MKHRILHTMIRVRDLKKSLQFYNEKLGMNIFRTEDYPSGEFTLVFVGYGDEQTSSVIELTYNYGDHKYTHGSGFGHIAIGVSDVYEMCNRIKKNGVKMLREPGPMAATATNGARDVIAFIQDPDGYKIELIEVE